MKLLQLTFKVRPAVHHPMFYEWQFGFLSIWLFGSSDEDARKRAEKVLEQLPYERVGEGISVRDRESKTGGSAEFRRFEKEALEVGLALRLASLATGVDEGDFETMELPLKTPRSPASAQSREPRGQIRQERGRGREMSKVFAEGTRRTPLREAGGSVLILKARLGRWCDRYALDSSRSREMVERVSERIENIKKAVESHAGCRATHVESNPVTEGYLNQIVWEGVVEVFDLDGHPKANRAYGWQFWEGKNAQYTVVLGIPPIDSPNAAVRASIAAEAEKMHDNSQ
jgi:hypothetical protein